MNNDDDYIQFALECLRLDMLDCTQIELILNYVKDLENENKVLKSLLKNLLT